MTGTSVADDQLLANERTRHTGEPRERKREPRDVERPGAKDAPDVERVRRDEVERE